LLDQIARLGEVTGEGKLVLAQVEDGKSGGSVIIPTRPAGVARISRDVVAEIRRLLP
jgi:hypothetical protein